MCVIAYQSDSSSVLSW